MIYCTAKADVVYALKEKIIVSSREIVISRINIIEDVKATSLFGWLDVKKDEDFVYTINAKVIKALIFKTLEIQVIGNILFFDIEISY